MLALRNIAVLIFLVAFQVNQVSAQCTNCPGGQWPTTTQSTTSTSLVNVSTCMFGGEYAVFNVTAGQTYTWSTCGVATWDTQLTLFAGGAGCVGGSLAYNDDGCGLQSTITWTATFTGQVSVAIHRWNCAAHAVCATLQWACTTCGSSSGGSNYNNPGGVITTCSGNFYDTGGPAGNYANNQSIVTTFCPSVAGNCISMNFSAFSLESNWDFLRIYDGTTTGAPIIGTYSGTQLNGVTVSASASNPSGCLTFWFTSDGSVAFAGWAATISCVGCATGPPPSSQDCAGATTICDDNTFNGNSSGPGVQELTVANSGCLAYENQSSWFFFSPTTTGTIAFMLTPTPLVDYDFAIWGPYNEPICPPNGPPLRCSFAAPAVPTGLQAGAGDNSEGAGGNGVVNPITVGPGDVGKVYVLFIDNWSASTTPFNFVWNNTGVILDCDPILVLPVELIDFYGYHRMGKNELFWSTASEINADHFVVERADDDFNFKPIGTINASGTTAIVQQYHFTDNNPKATNHYYRLKQVDFNGESETFNIISITQNEGDLIVQPPYPNPISENTLYLPITLKYDEQVTINVYDPTGRKILVQAAQLKRGFQQLELNFTDVPSGIYQLHISNNQEVVIYTSKIIR
jgi:hypothetical protein